MRRLDTIRHVETPESVELSLRVAGPIVRGLAWSIDQGIRVVVYVLAAIFLGPMGATGAGLLMLLFFLLEWFYPVLFEVLRNGATPGKSSLGIAVVEDDGRPIKWGPSIVRNLLRAVDFLPLGYLFGLIAMVNHRDFKRLGDLVAGTVVVHRKRPPNHGTMPDVPPIAPRLPLTQPEQQAIIAFALRSEQWPNARAAELADRVAPGLGLPTSARHKLIGVARWLSGIRETGPATNVIAEAPTPARSASMSLERFQDLHDPEWRAFETLLKHLERVEKLEDADDRDLRATRQVQRPAVTPTDLLDDFPGRYRRICQHLAVAQQRHYDGALVLRLNDLALRGHQHLYTRRTDRFALGRFLAFTLPRAVRAEWRLVLLSSVLFFGLMFVTALAVQFSPSLIYSIMDAKEVAGFEEMYDPNGTVQGIERTAADDIMMFGHYIKNNIGIGFQTFAGGLLLGIGTIFFLVYNGLVIGALMGHVNHLGYHETFYSFVLGHGSFELTAIVLAGVAGLILGRALVAPGRRTRSQALFEEGRRALPIIYGFTGMLVIAAVIEAFWSSARTIPPEGKYAVAACLWALVLAYFSFAGRVRET